MLFVMIEGRARTDRVPPKEKQMSAYLVFTKEKTLDAAELAVYQQKLFPTLATRGLKTLVAYGPHEVLEGPAVEGLVIVEFPSVEAAKGWYDSPEYREAREHRFKGAEFRCVLVQGVK
jgi:uncharacterized protein (DUF1330 family)